MKTILYYLDKYISYKLKRLILISIFIYDNIEVNRREKFIKTYDVSKSLKLGYSNESVSLMVLVNKLFRTKDHQLDLSVCSITDIVKKHPKLNYDQTLMKSDLKIISEYIMDFSHSELQLN